MINSDSLDDVPAGKHVLAVLDHTGDTKHMWSCDNEAEVAAARSVFTTLRSKGYLIFRVTGKDGSKGEQMLEFDPEAERMIATPPMRGG